MWRVACAALLLCASVTFASDKLEADDVGLPDNSLVLAFGDVNSDKSTDVFMVKQFANGTSAMDVYLWNRGQYSFLPEPRLRIVEPSPIDCIIPSDFNFDGKLDALVSGASNVTKLRWMHLYLGNFDSFAAAPIVLPATSWDVQPLLWDANDDLHPDLLAVLPATGVRAVWTNNIGQGFMNFSVAPQSLSGGALPTLARPHSSAFADFDGDCLADLLVVSQSNSQPPQRQFEIWINNKEKGYSLHSVSAIRPGTGQATVVDADGDGNLDIVFPVCFPADTCAQENAIHIFYNQQSALCGRWSPDGHGCRKADNLCQADPLFAFEDFSSTTASGAHVIVPASQLGGALFFTGIHAGPGPLANQTDKFGFAYPPITVRSGDINLDSFADFVVTLRNTDDPNATFVSLLLSAQCDSSSCHPDAVNVGRRYVYRYMDGTDPLESVPNAFTATFFDINDNGNLDIIVLSRDWQTNGLQSIALINQFEEDAYFLTTLVSNGVCNAWCPSSWPSKFPDPKPYGVNHPGAIAKFTVTDLSGSKTARIGVQLPQSAFAALQTPYNVHGLGRTNNYIEQFYVGVPLTTTHYFMWVAQIPNSQLVCFPFEWWQPSTWTLELFISPSARLLTVGLSLASTLVGLGGIIAFFHWREKKEDEAEMKQTEHLFAF